MLVGNNVCKDRKLFIIDIDLPVKINRKRRVHSTETDLVKPLEYRLMLPTESAMRTVLHELVFEWRRSRHGSDDAVAEVGVVVEGGEVADADSAEVDADVSEPLLACFGIQILTGFFFQRRVD